MKKVILLSILLLLTTSQLTISAPGKNRIKKTESQKMKKEIDRIAKRVEEINKEIEDYKKAEAMLDDLELKHAETVRDLRLDN